MASDFEKLKSKGTVEYTNAHKEGLPQSLRCQRLTAALSSYRCALNVAASDDQKASAAWNVAAASWALCRVQQDGGSFPSLSDAAKFAIVKEQVDEILPMFGDALACGGRAKDDAWVAKVLDSFERFINFITAFQRGILLDSQLRERFLWKSFSLVKQFPKLACSSAALAKLCLALAQFIFAKSTAALKLDVARLQGFHDSTRGFIDLARNDSSWHQRLKSAEEPVRVGLSLVEGWRGRNCSAPVVAILAAEAQEAALKEVEEDILRGICVGDSLIALCTGQQLFLQVLESSEDLRMDGLWEALDRLKEASLLLRGKDIGTEAFVISRMARVLEALQLKDVAARYYKTSVQLVISCNQTSPKLLQAWWYTDAVDKVAEYQRRVMAEDDRKQQQEREPYLLQLAKELKEIEKAEEKSAESFLKFLYETHPPKNLSHEMGSLEREAMKKTLQKSILHYHPDKNTQHGKLWEVLCEEITKVLNRKYDNYK